MKCEFNLSGGQTLVISANPFNEPSHSETGEEKPVIISLTLCQNNNKKLLLNGYPGEIDGFITFLQNRVDDIREMEEIRKKGWMEK